MKPPPNITESLRGSKLNTSVHFSSASEEWSTPSDVYAVLDAEFHFDFDPCPLGGTEDGTAPLFVEWRGKRAFVNPPYGPGIRPFLERGLEADVAVFLIPARLSTERNIMSSQPLISQFDLFEGEQLKEQGIAQAENSRVLLLMRAREVALELLAAKSEITYDDVYKRMEERNLHPENIGNAAGSIFRDPKVFRFTGKWAKSSRVTNHARVNRVWTLV